MPKEVFVIYIGQGSYEVWDSEGTYPICQFEGNPEQVHTWLATNGYKQQDVSRAWGCGDTYVREGLGIAS